MTAAAKPLLLIDVDGVLNPFGLSSKALPPGFASYRVEGFPVRLSRRHGEWLNSLDELFELTWGTAWEELANVEIGPRIGLPRLPVITFDAAAAGQTWKLRSVIAAVGDRPLAWIDDDLWPDARDWADRRTADGIPTLLVRTEPAVGLTRGHVEQLRAFGQRLADARRAAA